MRHRKPWFMILAVFVAVFLFTFLLRNTHKDEENVEAASLTNFDPGYIISDYQMGNYTSMTEKEIQEFLTAKNPCNNKDKKLYDNLVATYPNRKWHFENNHFVCLSEEKFGDGEVIGTGETAAHIIWQAAQDYKINPQVLVVLLEKEQSLVTDAYPNDKQYQAATGYGCPDTAPCSAQYFGFKNQVRKAAALFRTVLDGGWTNYPLGNNYVQYNPNASCGGSVVNIKNLATSALYRYTPYQPNKAALAAGYGAASCGAYGNRNFYLYFEDWFGGATDDAVKYVSLDTPRYMVVNSDAERINPRNQQKIDTVKKGEVLKFLTKVVFKDGSSCLRTEYSTQHKEDKCVMIGALGEVKLKYENVSDSSKRKIIKAGAKKYYIKGESVTESFDSRMERNIVSTTVFNGKTYGITQYDADNRKSEYGFLMEGIEEVPSYISLDKSLVMSPVKDVNKKDLILDAFNKVTLYVGRVYTFSSYIEIDGTKYYRTLFDTVNNVDTVVSENDLALADFVSFEKPVSLVILHDVERFNPVNNTAVDVLTKGREIRFSSKILIDGEWYYRTEHNTINGLCAVVPASATKEK